MTIQDFVKFNGKSFVSNGSRYTLEVLSATNEVNGIPSRRCSEYKTISAMLDNSYYNINVLECDVKVQQDILDSLVGVKLHAKKNHTELACDIFG